MRFLRPRRTEPSGAGRRPARRLLAGLALAWGCLFVSGCAGYRLGPTNGVESGSRSVQVRPFQNKTIEPRLVEAVTFALRKQLQQDGTYHLETGGEGDVLVQGTIVAYERQQLSLQARDALTPRDYRLTITAHVIATERATGKRVLDEKIKGYSDIRIGPDLASAERQALPLVAEDLARNATARLVDGQW